MSPGNAKGRGKGPVYAKGPALGGEQRQHGSEAQQLTPAVALAYLAAVHGLLDWAPAGMVPGRQRIKFGKYKP